MSSSSVRGVLAGIGITVGASDVASKCTDCGCGVEVGSRLLIDSEGVIDASLNLCDCSVEVSELEPDCEEVGGGVVEGSSSTSARLEVAVALPFPLEGPLDIAVIRGLWKSDNDS